MIKQIIYPTTEEECFVKCILEVNDIEISFEIPAIFSDGEIDQSATEEKVDTDIEIITKRITAQLQNT